MTTPPAVDVLSSEWSLIFGPLVPTLILLMPNHITNGVYPHANGGWSIPVWTLPHLIDDLREALSVATDAVNEVDAEVDPALGLLIHRIIAGSRALELGFNPLAPNIIGTVERMLRGQRGNRVVGAAVRAADNAREFMTAALWLSLHLALTGETNKLIRREALAYVAARARETAMSLMGGARPGAIEIGSIEPINMIEAGVLGFRSTVSSAIAVGEGWRETVTEHIETFFDIL